MLILFFFRKEIISEVLPVAMLFVNKHPTLLRIIFGLYISVLGLAIITASTLAASAVRRIAPMLPGFSGASAIKIKGPLDSFVEPLLSEFEIVNVERLKSFTIAIAKTPSVELR